MDLSAPLTRPASVCGRFPGFPQNRENNREYYFFGLRLFLMSIRAAMLMRCMQLCLASFHQNRVLVPEKGGLCFANSCPVSGRPHWVCFAKITRPMAGLHRTTDRSVTRANADAPIVRGGL